MKKSISKYKKVILISIILLILLILILIIVLSNLKKHNNVSAVKSYRDYSDMLIFKNSASDVYKGEVPAYKISSNTERIFEVFLPDIYMNVTGKKLEELLDYYQSDKSRIINFTGIENSDEFIEFIQKALAINCDFSEYESVTYTDGSYKKDGNEEIIKFVVKYKNGKELKCIMHINALSTETLDFRIEIE